MHKLVPNQIHQILPFDLYSYSKNFSNQIEDMLQKIQIACQIQAPKAEQEHQESKKNNNLATTKNTA